MKLPKSMISELMSSEMASDLLSTMMASLPYEDKFKPVSRESQVIHSLFDVMKPIIPDGMNLEGHMYFHLKHIDSSEQKQAAIRATLVKVFPLLETYFKDSEEVDTHGL